MLGIYIASGVIVCLGIAIAVFNRIEKLKRTIEAKQADLEEAKAESIRKENRLLVSFTEQSADFRKKMEMAEDELHFVKDQYDEMLKDQTTLTEDRDKFVLPELQVHALERVDGRVADGIILLDVLEFEHCSTFYAKNLLTYRQFCVTIYKL